LRATAAASKKDTVLTFTGSFTHWSTTFPERHGEHIFQDLEKKDIARMDDRYVPEVNSFQQLVIPKLKSYRYRVSKMIELLCVRELASELTKSQKEGRVTASIVNPGYVDTSILREVSGTRQKLIFGGLKLVFARKTEVGARTLVNAAEGGEETHGAYLDDCKPGQ
jgi:retinol dehydrogenase-12